MSALKALYLGQNWETSRNVYSNKRQYSYYSFVVVPRVRIAASKISRRVIERESRLI
jgi:hypothetical protein